MNQVPSGAIAILPSRIRSRAKSVWPGSLKYPFFCRSSQLFITATTRGSVYFALPVDRSLYSWRSVPASRVWNQTKAQFLVWFQNGVTPFCLRVAATFISSSHVDGTLRPYFANTFLL